MRPRKCHSLSDQAVGAEIARFCQVNDGVSFPMFAKTTVVGPQADPLSYLAYCEAGLATECSDVHQFELARPG